MRDAIRLYTDEHAPVAVVDELRRRGVDVLTARQAGAPSASDVEHLALVLEQGRATLTQDCDFLPLHARGLEHSGIIFARQQTPVGTLIRGVMLIYELLDADEMANHVEFV